MSTVIYQFIIIITVCIAWVLFVLNVKVFIASVIGFIFTSFAFYSLVKDRDKL